MIEKCDGVAVYHNRKIKYSDEGVWLRTPPCPRSLVMSEFLKRKNWFLETEMSL